MNNILPLRSVSRRIARGLALAGVIGVFAMTGISPASAQATDGSVFGKAPTGYSISVRSDATGTGRTVKVDSAGRYTALHLPPGTYTVTLKQGDQDVAKHLNVPVIVSRGVEVDFNCGEIKCNEAASTN
jgi:hypothetical protein